MRRPVTRWLVLAALLATGAAGGEDGFRPLYNGQNFDDWIVDTPAIWEIRDGVLIGKSAGLDYHEYLRTKQHYSDFILRAKMRIVSGQGNSGIQFRSRPVPDSHNVEGYQADAGVQRRAPTVLWGALYCEARHKMLATPSRELMSGLDLGAWHEYVITAQGNHIRLELDGVTTVDYHEDDPGIDRSGFIALQVHGSKEPIEVHFKDLWIKTLE